MGDCWLLQNTDYYWPLYVLSKVIPYKNVTLIWPPQWPGCHGQWLQSGVPIWASPLEVYPQAIKIPYTLWSLIYWFQTHATATSNGLISSIDLLRIKMWRWKYLINNTWCNTRDNSISSSRWRWWFRGGISAFSLSTSRGHAFCHYLTTSRSQAWIHYLQMVCIYLPPSNVIYWPSREHVLFIWEWQSMNTYVKGHTYEGGHHWIWI